LYGGAALGAQSGIVIDFGDIAGVVINYKSEGRWDCRSLSRKRQRVAE
jgi:hypothetical protein